jgi:hypothetical protein
LTATVVAVSAPSRARRRAGRKKGARPNPRGESWPGPGGLLLGGVIVAAGRIGGVFVTVPEDRDRGLVDATEQLDGGQ